MKSVYSAVRTGSLNKAVCASSVKGQITLLLKAKFTLKCVWKNFNIKLTVLFVRRLHSRYEFMSIVSFNTNVVLSINSVFVWVKY